MSWYGTLRGSGVGIAQQGFLAPGHYLPRNLPLTIEFPPTTPAFGGTANAYAAQFWAYLDGINDWLYSFQIVPRGGSGPHLFALITGPPGMQFGLSYWPSGWTAAQVFAAGYGRLLWRPLGNVNPATGWSGTVGVRVYSQEYQTDPTQYEDLYFPLSTVGPYNAQNGTGFLFNSQSRGSDSGAGTWASPFLSLLKIYGATTTPATTFPGAILGLLDGTFEAYDMGSGAGILMDKRYNPMSVIGNPQASSPILIDITNNFSAVFNAGHVWSCYTQGPDRYLSNFQFTGVPTTQPDSMRYIGEGYGNSRQMFDQISAPNVYSGQAPTGNASLISFETPGGGTLRQNIVVNGCSETNRVHSASANNFGMHDFYAVASGVTQFSSVTGANQAVQSFYLKDSCSNYVVRYNYSQGNSPGAMATGCQAQTSPSANIEIEYNIIDNPGTVASLRLNNAGSAGEPGQHWVRRNTIVGGAASVALATTPPYDGPYAFQANAIEWGTVATQAIMMVSGGSYVGGPLPSNITDSETECEAASGVVDSNYHLTGAFAQYEFTRGARIG